MIKRGVWVNVERSSVPEGRKLIGSKWVFKEKRGQKSVTLSTTEAEYVACSEVVKEVLFILQL